MKFIKYFENNNFKIGDIVYVIKELNDYFLENRFMSEEDYLTKHTKIYNI